MLDIGCQAREATTGWFRSLAGPGADLAFKLLGSTVLATPEMDSADMSRARELWGVSQTIANTCLVLLISLAGVTLVAGTSLPYETSVKDLLSRVLLAFLAANLSRTLIGYGISFANGLAQAFLDAGKSRIDPARAADVLGRGVEASINTGGAFLLIVDLVVIALAMWVVFAYVVRLAATMVLIAGAPVALMFHALPYTEGLAVLWWRAITGLLAIQVCQSLVFVTAMELLFTSDTPGSGSGHFYGIPTTKHDAIDLLMVACLLWILTRIPSWVSRTIWRQGRPRVTQRLVRTVVAYRSVERVLGRPHRRSDSPSTGRRRGDGGTGAASSRPGSGRRHGDGHRSGEQRQPNRQRYERHRDRYRHQDRRPDPQHHHRQPRRQPHRRTS